MIYSHSSQWEQCCHHEEQIAILQQKLMEIHNKLIDQLDLCKDKELTIIELNKRVMEAEGSRNTAFDTFKYQSFGQHSHVSTEKENQTPNYKMQFDTDSRISSQMKNQLLQADLQAMRNKVLAEITEKNKLKEDIKEFRFNHKKQLSLQMKKCEGVQSMFRRLQQEHELLKEKCDRVRRDHRSENQLERLAKKIEDLQEKIQKQKQNNRALSSQNRGMMQRIQQLQNELYHQRQYRSNEGKTHPENKFTQQIDSLKTQIDKLNKNVQSKDIEFRRRDKMEYQKANKIDRIQKIADRIDEKNKKRGFEETKQLIKRLEETQSNMRRNRKQV